MIEALNFDELHHICQWAKIVLGPEATLGDLQKYIMNNNIKRKAELLEKFFKEAKKILHSL